MSHPTTGITLLRFVDVLPPGTSDEDASDFLSQKMHEHGFKVYVRKPNRTMVFANGFPSPTQQYADALMCLTSPNGHAKEKIAKAKLQGPVINYGVEDPEISFLELDRAQVVEIASKKLAHVHWFVGNALRAEQDDVTAAASGLLPTSPSLRCLRPSDDVKEKIERHSFGGALKCEAEFTYEFRIQDIFVNASDLSSLQFETYKPNQRGDPFGIHDNSFAVYLAYRAAKKFHRSLRNGTRTKEDVIQWLSQRSTKSPYKTGYVAEQIFKYINPLHRRGIGGSVLPFNAEALRSFREQYPEEEDISDGLALIIVASIWWSGEYGRSMRHERRRLPDITDIEKALLSLGFSTHDEMLAIPKIIRARRSSSKKKAKTKTEKKPKLQVKSRLREAKK